jgi:hypothetical protein
MENDDDRTLVVEVPAIVDEGTFAAAQAQILNNKKNARRNRKRYY